MIRRRTILAAPAVLPLPVAAMAYADLVYRNGRLSWPAGSARAACGKRGVTRDKREGDHASPAGTYPLLYGFYRPDRMAWPHSDLPFTPLQPDFGWVDDPADRYYNRLVALPYAASHETMWRDDELYDLVVVIGYNTDPVVPGKGSAIFLHCASPAFSATEGCIAVAREVLVPLSGLLGPGSRITIMA